MKRIDFSGFRSLVSVMNYFRDDQVCKDALAQARWSDGDVVCPYCGEHHCVTRKDGRYRCKKCMRNFSVLVGTIFENTNLPLSKWFVAMYLISSHKKGVSSAQLARDIEASQASAWYMLQKIRLLYAQYDTESFSGVVECDEVYIGGKEKWKHQSMRTPNTRGRSTKTKTPVFGMVERSKDDGGVTKVHAFKVDKVDRETLHTLIGQFVDKGTTVITDELQGYKGLDELGYRHGMVNHGKEQFVDGELSTNSIEGFWAHFRRMIVGCYHNVSDEHLQQYIDEACFRWNTRLMGETMRFKMMFERSVGLVVRWEDMKLCA